MTIGKLLESPLPIEKELKEDFVRWQQEYGEAICKHVVETIEKEIMIPKIVLLQKQIEELKLHYKNVQDQQS
jgi:hypothetical protein